MARPRSEDRRNAILEAATVLIAAQGLGAPTAEIAKRAGVPHGSVFTYFETKGELFNVLFTLLTTELIDSVSTAVSQEGDTRAQLQQLWNAWIAWGASQPAKRRAQAHLNVSDQVTLQNREDAYEYAAPVFALIQRAAATGPLRDAPIRFVGAMFAACAATTIEFTLRDPSRAADFHRMGFEAIWHSMH